MILFKSKKKKSQYRPFQRPSLFRSNHRLKADFWSGERKEKRLYSRSLSNSIHRTYHSLCLSVTFIVRLFILIDRITRQIFFAIEKLIRILRAVHGWIQLLRSIFSALHLLIARLMILTFKIHQIFYLLTILFEPFSNRTFEKAARSFSHFLYNYYSSNGACYTLQARVQHIVHMVRTRWRRNLSDDDVFYDALNEEYQ